jgi:hypothetical protein
MTRKANILEALFNLSLLLLPVAAIITISIGGFRIFPQWLIILEVVGCFFLFVLGLDELRGKPTLYQYFVSIFRVLSAGHASFALFQKKTAEALANALITYNRMPAEQRESLSQWIIDNHKSSFKNRFWAIAKIIVSTILLTILVQEPAIIAFKWLLKTLFDFSY